MKTTHLHLVRGLLLAAIIGSQALLSAIGEEPAPLAIRRQGSFLVGGAVVKAPGTFDPIRHGAYNPAAQETAGQTLHGDHAYVFYQVPAGAHALPLVMWHGHGQSAKTWETTPDGREGFQTLFLRRNYAVYLVDQPRRGRAARSTQPMNLPVAPDEQLWFGIFRLGTWPELYKGVQFPRDEASLEQFFRQMVPNTGPFNLEVNASAASALFDRIGEGILVTHSQSGGMGWRTVMKNRNVKAVVSFEPGSNFPFPAGELPEPISHASGRASGIPVKEEEFASLTRIPILIYYGDHIPEEPTTNPGQDQWRANLALARRWRDVVNRHGGDVTLVHLPEIGIHGNTHFPMSDLNNTEVAENMAQFLERKGLSR